MAQALEYGAARTIPLGGVHPRTATDPLYHPAYASFFRGFNPRLNLSDPKFTLLGHKFYQPAALRSSLVDWKFQPSSFSRFLNTFVRGSMTLREDKTKALTSAYLTLPPIDPQQVSWYIQNDRLNVVGQRRSWNRDTSWPWTDWQRDYFRRSISIPKGTIKEDIKASVVNGIMKVSFPDVN